MIFNLLKKNKQAIILYTPLENEIGVARITNFMAYVSGALNIRLQIAEDIAFLHMFEEGDVPHSVSGVGWLEISNGMMMDGLKDYYWRVRAAPYGAWSNIWKFTTGV